MRWLRKVFRRSGDESAESVDVDAVLDACRRDPWRAAAGLNELEGKHRRLLRQRKTLQKRMSRFSSAHVRDIARSGPQFGPIQLQTEMRMRDEAGQDARMGVQESDLEARIREVEGAMVEVKGILRGR